MQRPEPINLTELPDKIRPLAPLVKGGLRKHEDANEPERRELD